MIWGQGLGGVEGSGFRALGFRVQGLGFRVQGLEFRVQGLEAQLMFLFYVLVTLLFAFSTSPCNSPFNKQVSNPIPPEYSNPLYWATLLFACGIGSGWGSGRCNLGLWSWYVSFSGMLDNRW